MADAELSRHGVDDKGWLQNARLIPKEERWYLIYSVQFGIGIGYLLAITFSHFPEVWLQLNERKSV